MRITDDKATEIRKDFPIFERKIKGYKLSYLDNAATTQKPNAVINSISKYYKETNANIHRGVYPLAEEATECYESARVKVASFIGAAPEEVIFTRNTTESLNVLARTVSSVLDKGRNEILLTEMEHHSNLLPWQCLAKREGFKIKYIPIKDDFTLDYDAFEKRISNKTALVSTTHISNSLGTINDIKKIFRVAHKFGALTCADAAQSVSRIPLDVSNLECDFLAFSAHKMMGPTGLGVLFGRKNLLDKMEPALFGGGMIKKASYECAEWGDPPHKFEAGTPDISGAVGIDAAIDYINKIGVESISQWEEDLLKEAMRQLESVKGIRHIGPSLSRRCGIMSFVMEGVHPHDVSAALGAKNVCIRGGHHCNMPLMEKLGLAGTSRASFYAYNTFEDINRMVAGIKETKALFAKGSHG